jgi:hypothetical protein
MARKKNSGSKGGAKSGKLLRTPFMAEFTQKFIGEPNRFLWPKQKTERADVVKQYQAFVKVLLTAGYGLGIPKAKGSPAADVVKFLKARNWPNDPTGIPKKYLDRQTTVRLVEIAVILDRLLRAVNRYKGGPGGGPSGWPPHGPGT